MKCINLVGDARGRRHKTACKLRAANARDIKRLCLAKTRRRISCEARPPPGIVSLSHNYRESRFKVEFHLNKA